MPINKAVLAAFKAASKLKPDVKDSYAVQRMIEEAIGKLSIPNPMCRIEDKTAVMPDGHNVRLRVFTPRDVIISLKTGLRVTEDYRGTILFFHGGGWVNGGVDYYIDACASTAVRLERRVISVDYRRAPEHRFPQAPNDCYEVARQLFAGTLLSDVEPENIVLFGDSAGGNLAAVVSLMARDRGEFTPNTQMLLYPATYNDHNPQTSIFDSVRENGEDYLLTARDVVSYMNLYAACAEDLNNPRLAPLLEPDLSCQPKTLLISAEYCPLRDEGETYAARLQIEGNEVECFRMLDAVHGYLLYPSILNVVRDTYRIMKNFLDGDDLGEEGDEAWQKLLGID